MRRRQPLKSNKLKKWLAAPYAVWAAGFIIIPLILILYYAFTGEEGGFTLSNCAYVATKENIKALGLALWLSLLSTALCLLLAYPLAMILANRNVESEIYIETGDLKGDGSFVFHRPGKEPVTVYSIEKLLQIVLSFHFL